MENIISIYDQLIIHAVSYESGSCNVTVWCDLLIKNKKINSSFLISHTDLNRMVAKIIASGYSFEPEKSTVMIFEDGTEVIDYQFEKTCGTPVILDHFEFTNKVTEIRA